MRVAEDERTPRAEVVEVAPAVGVPDARAFAADDERRQSAHGLESAHGGIHAPRDHALRPREELFGSGQSQRAKSLAWYVRMMSAPARAIDVSVSLTTLSSSIHPRCAAAFTIAYSPETL